MLEGLPLSEVHKRAKMYGANEIEGKKRYSVLFLLVSQFTSPLIYVLLGAISITLFLGDYTDAVIISLAVIVNTFLGFWQEYKAEKSLERLASVLMPRCLVIRGGERVEVATAELVPGDVVVLEAGERIPADGVLWEGHGVSVNEAILTGESVPVTKKVLSESRKQKVASLKAELLEQEFVAVEQREKLGGDESLYAGTLILSGSITMIVAYTGVRTEVGKIAAQLSNTKVEETPLQRKLSVLSRRLALMVGVLAVVILVIGLVRGQSFLEMFKLSVAVAVSAIPEGLVVSLTAILALGMQRILKRKALVRKMVAAEVLGSVSWICSDKTGTLTEGNLKVKKVETIDEGLLKAAAIIGSDFKDPMEVVFYDWAANNLHKSGVEKVLEDFPRLDRMPFSSERKMAATLTGKELFVTGAPELVLSKCYLSSKERLHWEGRIQEMASEGYRLVAVAHRKRMGEKKINQDLLSQRLYWLGLVAYEDSVRVGVKKVLPKVARAGIKVSVITGDFRSTAMAVMSKLGIPVTAEEVIEGSELEQLSEAELDHRIQNVKLFARTSPSQKLKIVESLQRMGAVVAMTGDGVNDAPALKKADIGIVVSSASDVSKETADIVLLNDDFSTIVAAVDEGRGIFENLRKVVLYLLANSFAEVLIVMVGLVMRWPLAITASQILWVNLVDDGLPSLALTLEPKDENLLKKPPRKPDEPILDKEIMTLIVLISVMTGLFVLLIFWWYWGVWGMAESYARTVSFTLLAMCSLVYVFSSRSLSKPVWQVSLLSNPWLLGGVGIGAFLQVLAVYTKPLQAIFDTVPMALVDWVIVMGMSGIVLLMVEVVKYIFWRFSQKQ